MKFISLEYIKEHSRLDYNCEDSLLTLYANSAEDTVLNIMNRTYHDLIENYGEVPAAIMQATLMLVDAGYLYRNPISPQNLSTVGYAFDMLIKPYMQLANESGSSSPQLVTLGSEVKILLSTSLPYDLKMEDVDFNVTVLNDDEKGKSKHYAKEDCKLTQDGEYIVLLDTEELGVGSLMVKEEFMIPDSDFPSGYRKEVIRINPNIKVVG